MIKKIHPDCLELTFDNGAKVQVWLPTGVQSEILIVHTGHEDKWVNQADMFSSILEEIAEETKCKCGNFKNKEDHCCLDCHIEAIGD